MSSSRLEDRYRAALGADVAPPEAESLSFAVDFVRLAVRALSLEEPRAVERKALVQAVHARTGLGAKDAGLLLGMALAPEFRATVDDHDLTAFAARFGDEAARALAGEANEELDLAGFTQRYGASEALLLMDTLFAVAGADGQVRTEEVRRLGLAATELGVDGVLVSALLQKHDPRHASGDLRFELLGDRMVIGRSTSADVCLPDPQVAVRHAELVRVGQAWRVVDLQSGRPTVLNGVPVSSAPIEEGGRLRIGPYTLRLVNGALEAFGERSFSSLSMRKLERSIGEVCLLDDLSFTVFSGEVIALVGPSGAGKTTLLNAISGVAPADSGEVLLDGQDFHSLLNVDRSLVGNVPQDDLVHPELTVEESLFYAGRLRFPADVTAGEIHTETERVLGELGIERIRDSRIGDALRRGISGGQRKRVNLGTELMTRSTRVLFLDEPTSGLDPRASQDIVRLVRTLADHGRIVFLVTHDLTPEVMAQCDHLLVLVEGGRLAYFGPPDDACRYFGVATPDAIFNRFGDHQPAEWGERYRESLDRRKFVATREHLLGVEGLAAEAVDVTPVRNSFVRQLLTLSGRYLRVKLRDRTGMFVLGLQPPVLTAVMWVVFPAASSPMLFMLALCALWFGMSAAVRELINDRVIWRRERRVGVRVSAYVASKVAVLGPMIGLQCTAMAVLLFFAVDMSDYGFVLWKVIGMCTLTGWVGMSLGLLTSASWNSSEAAVGTLPLLLVPQITLSSIMVSVRSMGDVASALTWLTVQRYSFDGVIKTGTHIGVANRLGEFEALPNQGQLYLLGLKWTSDADDHGLSLMELVGALGLWVVGFLGVTLLVVWAKGRRAS